MYEKVVEFIFKDTIQKYSSSPAHEVYNEDTKNRTITFCVYSDTLEFVQLEQLASLLNTKNINFRDISDRGGYCDSCGWSANFVKIVCNDVSFDNEPLKDGVPNIVRLPAINLYDGEPDD